MSGRMQRVKEYAESVFPWVLAVKDALHQIPEAGFEEVKTARTLENILTELQIPFGRMCKTGIVAVIEGRYPGKTVAVRADMDGLPVTEQPQNPVCSLHPGSMHACGHDAHMAIALGTARYFAENREQLCGNVKLLFQPAEETDGGALPMISAGCLENPPVDFCIGQHVQPYLQVGEAECRKGVLNGASNTMEVKVLGKGGHGASPHNAVDAVAIAAHLVCALQTLVSREVDPADSAVISIGKIQGGTAGNIIADTVRFRGIIRTVSQNTREHLKKRIPALIEGIARGMGGGALVDLQDGYEALVNDGGCVDVFNQAAAEYLGPEKVFEKESPGLGVEDFAFFARQVPSVFYHIGCSDKAKRENGQLHSSSFQVEPETLKFGVGLQIYTVLKLLGG